MSGSLLAKVMLLRVENNSDFAMIITSIQIKVYEVSGMQSQDLVIRTERSVIDVVLKLEQDIVVLREEMRAGFEAAKEDRQAISEVMRLGFEAAKEDRQAIREEMRAGFEAQQKQIDGLHTEMLVMSERMNSMNVRLSDMQYTLNFGVTVGSLLLVALPIVWGMYKLFTGKISDIMKGIAKEAIREELGHNAE